MGFRSACPASRGLHTAVGGRGLQEREEVDRGTASANMAPLLSRLAALASNKGGSTFGLEAKGAALPCYKAGVTPFLRGPLADPPLLRAHMSARDPRVMCGRALPLPQTVAAPGGRAVRLAVRGGGVGRGAALHASAPWPPSSRQPLVHVHLRASTLHYCVLRGRSAGRVGNIGERTHAG